MAYTVIIPARLKSTRLPDKPLADIAGKPMILRVVEQALKSSAKMVVVATDAMPVQDAVTLAGYACILTREDHPSGTDRLAEAAERLGLGDDDIVVNVQGDEPLIEPALIEAVAGCLAADPDLAIATASHAIHSAADFFNPNVVKVVRDQAGRALYFSRAPMPWARDAFNETKEVLPFGHCAQRHIGIYAYRVSFLRAYAKLAPSPLEQFEALEQLRALWHGYRIGVIETATAPAAGVDTQEDLERVRAVFAASGT